MSTPYKRQQDVTSAAIAWAVGGLLSLSTLNWLHFRHIVLLIKPQIGILNATGLHACLASHRVQLEGQLRQLLEKIMEEGSLSIEASH